MAGADVDRLVGPCGGWGRADGEDRVDWLSRTGRAGAGGMVGVPEVDGRAGTDDALGGDRGGTSSGSSSDSSRRRSLFTD